MTDINFLPAEYWHRRASQRDRWYILAIGLASLGLLLGNMLNQSRRAENLLAQLNSLEAQKRDSLALAAEIQRLEARQSVLSSDAKFYSFLRAHPSMSRVMVAVATSCPDRLTLNSIRMQRNRQVATEVTPTGRNSKSPPAATSGKGNDSAAAQLDRFFSDIQQSHLSLEITGVAESDIEVSQFIDRLERSDCFAEVTLTDTDSTTAGASAVRGFKIQCGLARAL